MNTIAKIREAALEGRNEDAAQLADYFLEEARIIYEIYAQWSADFLRFLEKEGIAREEVEAARQRLLWLLKGVRGEPFDPQEWWGRLNQKVSAVVTALREQGAGGLGGLEDVRESWRQLHDRYVDYLYGILTFIAEREGEERIEDAYRFSLKPYFDKRYQPFDLRRQPYEETLYRNLYLAFESMRGHLAGPGRAGDIELKEYEDRWTLEFDPCGSGGRAMRGDPVEGTGSRTEAPYGFGVTTKEYDWAWNTKGICYYCAHCCLALERLPAETWGHPVRVVDPPTHPDRARAKCKWTVYKSVEAIPEEAYRRIGLTKRKG